MIETRCIADMSKYGLVENSRDSSGVFSIEMRKLQSRQRVAKEDQPFKKSSESVILKDNWTFLGRFRSRK